MARNNLKVRVMSAYKAEEYANNKNCETSIIISISSYRGEKANIIPNKTNKIQDVYFSVFDDTDDNTSIKPEEANEIAKFVISSLDKYKDLDTIIVNCEAGQSRSAGLAGAIMKWLWDDDTEIFNSTRYTPNMRVYRTMLNALMHLEYKKAADKNVIEKYKEDERIIEEYNKSREQKINKVALWVEVPSLTIITFSFILYAWKISLAEMLGIIIGAVLLNLVIYLVAVPNEKRACKQLADKLYTTSVFNKFKEIQNTREYDGVFVSDLWEIKQDNNTELNYYDLDFNTLYKNNQDRKVQIVVYAFENGVPVELYIPFNVRDGYKINKTECDLIVFKRDRIKSIVKKSKSAK